MAVKKKVAAKKTVTRKAPNSAAIKRKKARKETLVKKALAETAKNPKTVILDTHKERRILTDSDMITVSVKLQVPTDSLGAAGKQGWVEIDDDYGDGNDQHSDGWTAD